VTYVAQKTVEEKGKLFRVDVDRQAQGGAGGDTLLVVELSNDVRGGLCHDGVM
jgi:hypothetical protein